MRAEVPGGVGEMVAPAGGRLVQQQAIGRTGGIGERADETAIDNVRAKVMQRRLDTCGARWVADEHAGVLGQALVQFQRRFFLRCRRELAVALGAECECVVHRSVLRHCIGGRERIRKRAPFQLQPVASFKCVEVLVAAFGRGGDGQRRLQPMEHFVSQQRTAPGHVLRQWPEQLRPAYAGPFHGGVGNDRIGRKLAHEHLATRLQRAVYIRMRGGDLAALRIDQHQRPAQGLPPQLAAIGLAQVLCLDEDSARVGVCDR